MLGNQFDNGGTHNDAVGHARNVGGLFGGAHTKANRDGQVGLGLETGDGFIDWEGINFDGRHGAHPHTVGAVQWFQPEGPGWADPAKHIVMGGSYGGYMTLACLTMQPELWAAGVDTAAAAAAAAALGCSSHAVATPPLAARMLGPSQVSTSGRKRPRS